MTERLRYRNLSARHAGFTRSRFSAAAQGSAWFSPIMLPFEWGVLRRLNCLRILPQASRLRSTRLMRSATVRTAHACSKVFTYGKVPGLRTNAVCGKCKAMCLKLMRTVSQLLKLVPTIYQKDPGALLCKLHIAFIVRGVFEHALRLED
jgi:hypothetical protein